MHVRLGGGVATIREFLDAELVDTMHIAVAWLNRVVANGCGARSVKSSIASIAAEVPGSEVVA